MRIPDQNSFWLQGKWYSFEEQSQRIVAEQIALRLNKELCGTNFDNSLAIELRNANIKNYKVE